MISFTLDDEQTIARDTAEDFAATILRPAMRDADTRGAHAPALLDGLWALGLVAAHVDQPDPVTTALMLEELGHGDASAGLAMASVIGAVGLLAHHSHAEHRRWARDLADGRSFAGVVAALLEPEFGADWRQPRTRAEAGSGGGYRLQGGKAMVPMAATASHFVVSAMAPDGPGCFLIAADAPGVTRGAQTSTLGLKALGLGSVAFDGVALDASARIGEGGVGLERLMAGARLASAAVLTGLSRAVLDYVLPYTKERIAHGGPIAQKQSVAFRLADMHIEVEAQRWMSWRGAAELAAQLPSAPRSAQLAYRYGGEQAVWISDEGVQMLGGHGFVRDHPVELWYRDARTLSVVEGLGGL